MFICFRFITPILLSIVRKSVKITAMQKETLAKPSRARRAPAKRSFAMELRSMREPLVPEALLLRSSRDTNVWTWGVSRNEIRRMDKREYPESDEGGGLRNQGFPSPVSDNRAWGTKARLERTHCVAMLWTKWTSTTSPVAELAQRSLGGTEQSLLCPSVPTRLRRESPQQALACSTEARRPPSQEKLSSEAAHWVDTGEGSGEGLAPPAIRVSRTTEERSDEGVRDTLIVTQPER